MAYAPAKKLPSPPINNPFINADAAWAVTQHNKLVDRANPAFARIEELEARVKTLEARLGIDSTDMANEMSESSGFVSSQSISSQEPISQPKANQGKSRRISGLPSSTQNDMPPDVRSNHNRKRSNEDAFGSPDLIEHRSTLTKLRERHRFAARPGSRLKHSALAEEDSDDEASLPSTPPKATGRRPMLADTPLDAFEDHNAAGPTFAVPKRPPIRVSKRQRTDDSEVEQRFTGLDVFGERSSSMTLGRSSSHTARATASHVTDLADTPVESIEPRATFAGHRSHEPVGQHVVRGSRQGNAHGSRMTPVVETDGQQAMLPPTAGRNEHHGICCSMVIHNAAGKARLSAGDLPDEIDEALGKLISEIIDAKEEHKPKLESWTIAAKRTTGCIMQRMQEIGVKWAFEDKDYIACRVCFNTQRPCLRWSAKSRRYYICALPAQLRGNAQPRELSYYVYEEANASGEVQASFGDLWKK